MSFDFGIRRVYFPGLLLIPYNVDFRVCWVHINITSSELVIYWGEKTNQQWNTNYLVQMHNLILQLVIHFLSVSQRKFLCYMALRVGNVSQFQLSLKNMEIGASNCWIWYDISVSLYLHGLSNVSHQPGGYFTTAFKKADALLLNNCSS